MKGYRHPPDTWTNSIYSGNNVNDTWLTLPCKPQNSVIGFQSNLLVSQNRIEMYGMPFTDCIGFLHGDFIWFFCLFLPVLVNTTISACKRKSI